MELFFDNETVQLTLKPYKYGQIVEHTEIFDDGMTTDLGERNLWILTC